jgi:alanine dehydrogenase
MTLILSQKDVIEVLNMKDCMQVVERAFLEFDNGSAIQPLRNNIQSDKGISLYMPAYLGEMKALACKVVTVFKGNPSDYKMPVILGKVLLQDTNTGEVICIMDGSYLTAVRTGASSGVATKYLAQEKAGMIAGIIGTGVQAKMQLAAITEARDIQKVIIYDISDKAAQEFVKEIKPEFSMDFIIANHPDEVLQADIICTATSSSTPVFDGSKVRPGTHINGIGTHTPDTRELDSIVVSKSKFVGDSKEACFSEAGDFMIPLENKEISAAHFYAELGEIISNKKTGRSSDDEITVFKSTGLAIQDAATAQLVYEKAIKFGVGKEIEI